MDSTDDAPHRVKLYSEADMARSVERREQLRIEELDHLTGLRDRIQDGMDSGVVDLCSGTEMLLNISKARLALSGVGVWPTR